MRQVNCMACLATGIILPMGTEDRIGVVHYVKWIVGTRRKGCYRLCDFDGGGEGLIWKVTGEVDVNALIQLEEP